MSGLPACSVPVRAAAGRCPTATAIRAISASQRSYSPASFPTGFTCASRMFSGNEDKLPADSHFLYALIAPRPVLDEHSNGRRGRIDLGGRTSVPDRSAGVTSCSAPRRITSNAIVPAAHDYQGERHSDRVQRFSAHGGRGKKDRFRSCFPRNPIHPWGYDAWAARNPIDVKTFPKVKAQRTARHVRRIDARQTRGTHGGRGSRARSNGCSAKGHAYVQVNRCIVGTGCRVRMR